MSTPWRFAEQRILDLLADQAAFGLVADDRRQLDGLLETMPGLDAECMERTAALVELASLPRRERMPAKLQEDVRARARRFFHGEPNGNTNSWSAIDR